MSLLALSIQMPMEKKGGYSYPVPPNPLTLPPRIKTTTKPPTKELPPCPLNCDDVINIRAMEIPGQTCRELEPCPENPDNVKDVPGKTCQVPCPQGYNYPTPENPLTVPPKTSTTPIPTTTTELPPCSKICDENVDIRTEEIPGVTCKELPDCPENPAEYDPLEPGVTCNVPCEGYEYPTPRNPLTLPPRPSTTPSTPTTSEGYNYDIPENPLNLPRRPNELVDPPVFLGSDFQININELPDFDPENFRILEESERTALDLTPLTTPSTPIFQRVPILEPVLIKSCSEMKDKIPGVNCLDETEIITSPLDLQQLDSEDLKPCLDVTQDGTIEPMPGVNCLLEPVLLLIPEDAKGISKPILGLDFNLATKIFAPKKK